MKRMTRFSLVALSVVSSAALVAEGAKTATTTTPASSTTNTSASKVSATQSCQICVVDANQVMSQTKEAKEQNDKLTKRQKQLTADVQKIAQELKSKMDELETKKSTLSQKALENLQNEILALRGKYESTVQTSENTLKLDVQRATEALSAEAEKAGKQLAQAGNFDVVLDAASGRPIYISEKVKSNTQELVKIMDKNYDTKSKTAKA